jgi:Bifunctional DNA primase/polymerase, N-terminal/DnaB-like helicase C terminal domain
MIQWALRYQKLGLSIIPLKPKGKEPLVSWQYYQKIKASEIEIRNWWTKWPNANIGIVTGAISQVVVVDLDGEEGIKSANLLNLKSTVISLTGNGKHLWYRYPNTSVQNAVKVYRGIDIRGDRGFIVAPPSIHESGKRYRWIGQSVSNVAQLPLFPAQIFVQPVKTAGTSKHEPGWIAKALEEMKIGNIDNTLTSIVGRMRRDGYSRNDVLALLTPIALDKGAEPGHLEAKIENIWNRYPAKMEEQMRLHKSYEQSLFLPTKSQFDASSFIIHSPTNPDSIKQFEQLQFEHDGAYNRSILKSGYNRLDSMLTAGLKSSRLFVVAARTGTGKTNWLLGCAKYLCESGKKVLLFSTEMPYTEIWQRYRATLENPDSFCEHQFYVCDSFAPNIEKVEEAINVLRPDVFMFDHINHVSEEGRELGAFMQGLNFLRRKYDTAGIISAQLNRQADWVDIKTGEKVTPRMSMIKGSGTIEQAASRVLLLSETHVTPEYTEIIGNLDKNDNGSKGLIHFGLYNNPWRMEEL